MSFHIDVSGEQVSLHFERLTTNAFAELLKRTEGEKCKVDHPCLEEETLWGYIDEVVLLPSLHRGYARVMWVVELDIHEILEPMKEGAELKISNLISYQAGGSFKGAPTFKKVFKASLRQPTKYEHFLDMTLPVVNKASSKWDHKLSIEELLFNHKGDIYVKRTIDALPWMVPHTQEVGILIEQSLDDIELSSPLYTYLTLDDEGWIYNCDLTTSDELEKHESVESAIKAVQNAEFHIRHNP